MYTNKPFELIPKQQINFPQGSVAAVRRWGENTVVLQTNSVYYAPNIIATGQCL